MGTDATYARIEQAIRYIEDHRLDQPGLDEIAEGVGLSPFHLQRLFTDWAGVSPKQFLRYVTFGHAREVLRESGSVLDAAYDAGLSGPGRLHDLSVTLEAATPGEVGTGGRGLEIAYGHHDGAFGPFLIGVTGRGVCTLAFHAEDDADLALADLRASWPNADLIEDPARTWETGGEAVARGTGAAGRPIRLWAQGTNFQIKVWEALLRIPPGRLVGYADIARFIGRPTASRAVGQAVGANPIAVLIPCHRVIRASGGFETGYRWGSARKRALIAWEAAQSPKTSAMV